MKYRGVSVCYLAMLDKYLFIYDGCPDDYLKDSFGENLYIKDVTKAKGYIDCLIHLGWI